MKFNVAVDVSVDEEKAKTALARSLAHIVRSGENEAASRAEVDTGGMKAGIKARRLSRFSWLLVSEAEYSIFVEKGTAPHTIEAEGSGALFWEGADHPVRSVEHPGTDANPFMRPALEHMASIAPDVVASYLDGSL